jgi:uncharacterized protein
LIEQTFQHCPGIGPVTEFRLKRSGFSGWADCLKQPHRLPLGAATRRRFLRWLERSVQALSDEDIAFFVEHLPIREHWRILARWFQQATFFDIETTGLSPYHNDVGVICAFQSGCLYRFVRGPDLDGFLQLVDQSALLVAFNGSSFDVPFLERTFNLPGIGRPCVDLRWMLYHQGYTGGLKAIERTMGLRRPADLADIDGAAAVMLDHRWQAGDLQAGALLVRYCAVDALATYLISGRMLSVTGVSVLPEDAESVFQLVTDDRNAAEWSAPVAAVMPNPQHHRCQNGRDRRF